MIRTRINFSGERRDWLLALKTRTGAESLHGMVIDALRCYEASLDAAEAASPPPPRPVEDRHGR